MYDRHLDTFLQAADSGSFLKAADKLYISANAVTKQVNLLEDRLGVKLFHRSTQGLALTEAGRLIYDEAKKMIRHSNAVLRKARELEQKKEAVIHIGVSLMNPAAMLLREWAKAAARYPNIRLEIISFEDSVPAFNEVLDHLGETIDLISCPYQTTFWGDRYRSFHLWDLPLCVACSKTHPLARRESLTFSDLHGETLTLSRKGINSALDPLWDELARDHPQIHLNGVDYVDMASFNRLVSTRELILSAACWKDVHPLLATVPLECGYRLPYGLIYAKEPSQEVLQFIMAIGSTEP